MDLISNTRKKIVRVERNEISTVVEIMLFCTISGAMIADRIDRSVCLCVADSAEHFGLDSIRSHFSFSFLFFGDNRTRIHRIGEC